MSEMDKAILSVVCLILSLQVLCVLMMFGVL